MDRRKFISSTVAGLAGPYVSRVDLEASEGPASQSDGLKTINEAREELFPCRTLASLEWTQFGASGFSKPACGIVYRKDSPAECGVPLGTVDTGCIDLDTDGTFGYCSMFGAFAPPRPVVAALSGNQCGKSNSHTYSNLGFSVSYGTNATT